MVSKGQRAGLYSYSCLTLRLGLFTDSKVYAIAVPPSAWLLPLDGHTLRWSRDWHDLPDSERSGVTSG
jgi:hypothetical protein